MHALLTACLLHCYQSPEYTQALLSEGGHALLPGRPPEPRLPPRRRVGLQGRRRAGELLPMVPACLPNMHLM